jgi:hypothetical protein
MNRQRDLASCAKLAFMETRGISMIKVAFAIPAALLLSGCATVSFAPPSVNLAERVSSPNSTSCSSVPSTTERVDDHDDSESALFLIDNYLQAYGCALATASNGRQAFQIPSHLAALLGVAGAAFGGSSDLALGSGIAASTFNSANSYWAPQEKAAVIDSAYDALLCIRTEAVGIDYIDTTKSPDGGPPKIAVAGDSVKLDPQWRYYGLISAALRQVDRITASRLRSIGKFDPAGLVAEIEALNMKIVEAEQAKKKAATPAPTPTPSPSPSPSASPDGPAEMAEDDGGGTNAASSTKASADDGLYSLELAALQPKIQRCVVRAKM